MLSKCLLALVGLGNIQASVAEPTSTLNLTLDDGHSLCGMIMTETGANFIAEEAAEVFALQGRKVTLSFPIEPHGDFNDALMNKERAA